VCIMQKYVRRIYTRCSLPETNDSPTEAKTISRLELLAESRKMNIRGALPNERERAAVYARGHFVTSLIVGIRIEWLGASLVIRKRGEDGGGGWRYRSFAAICR
jgi:hypothetical protein